MQKYRTSVSDRQECCLKASLRGSYLNQTVPLAPIVRGAVVGLPLGAGRAADFFGARGEQLRLQLSIAHVLGRINAIHDFHLGCVPVGAHEIRSLGLPRLPTLHAVERVALIAGFANGANLFG